MKPKAKPTRKTRPGWAKRKPRSASTASPGVQTWCASVLIKGRRAGRHKLTDRWIKAWFPKADLRAAVAMTRDPDLYERRVS